MKKFIRAISLIACCIITPWTIILCCGPSLSDDEERFSLFNTGLDNASGLEPYTFAKSSFGWFEPVMEPDYKRNCKEWLTYTGSKVSEKDIYTIQYQTLPNVFVNAYQRNDWSVFKGNSFIKWITQKNNRTALDYMWLAKKAEAVNLQPSDAWDTTFEQQKTAVALLANIAGKRMAAAPQFLRQRYAFQAMKLWFYINNSSTSYAPSIIKAYDDYLQGEHSIVASWAKIYYAMVQKDANRQTLYLLKAFEESAEKKQFAYLRIEKSDLQKLVAVTKDPETLALAYSMMAIKTKGRALPDIKKIAAYNAHAPFLPLIIGREINKLESWIWSPEMLGFYTDRWDAQYNQYPTKTLVARVKKDKLYLAELRTFLEGWNMTKKVPCYSLALAHLYNMEGKYHSARTVLNKLPVYTDRSLEIQRLVEKVIMIAGIGDIRNAATKQQLAIHMNKMFRLNSGFKRWQASYEARWDDQTPERSDEYGELMLYLSRRYQQTGDRVSAGLLYTKAKIATNSHDGWGDAPDDYTHIAWFDRHANAADLDSVLALKKKQTKNDFEKLLTPVQWAYDDMYSDVKGTILFRQKRYKEAYEVFKSMNPDFWEKHYAYKDYLPRMAVTNTGLIPEAGSKKNKYSKTSKRLIMEDVVAIVNGIDNATDNETKAGWRYQLANMQLNTTYNGRAWMMFSYGKSSNEPFIGDEYPEDHWWGFTFWPNYKQYGNDYYMCASAIDNYTKALNLSTNKELKAKCLLGLVSCKNSSMYDLYTNKAPVYLRQNKSLQAYFYQIKNYRFTNAYKQAAVHCPDIIEYANAEISGR